jgi:hypothetical protein
VELQLQNPALSDWRLHASGMQRLIDMRGGIKKLSKEAPYMISSLVIYILVINVGNVFSPSWDQIRISSFTSFEQTIKDVADLYSLMFPYTLCPPELYFDMLKTTELRGEASRAGGEDPWVLVEAYEILARVEAFKPEDWAEPGM